MKIGILLIGLMFIMTKGLLCADNALTPQEEAAGWTLLFDGKTLNGWTSAKPQARAKPATQRSNQEGSAPVRASSEFRRLHPSRGSNPQPCKTAEGQMLLPAGDSHWEVFNGSLMPCGDQEGYLISKENFKDFVLTFDFKAAEDANSSVGIRGPEGKAGYPVQIFAYGGGGYNTGSIVGLAKTDREYKFIGGQWNHYEITADGDHLVVVLNGEKTLDVHDSEFSEGKIRLQYAKFPIKFKNIKLKVINH